MPDYTSRLPHAVSPTFEQWFNGNPYEMIKHGTYKTWRHKLKGFTEEQMATFDALDLDVNGKSSESLEEKKIAFREKSNKKMKEERKSARAIRFKEEEERKKRKAERQKEAEALAKKEEKTK